MRTVTTLCALVLLAGCSSESSTPSPAPVTATTAVEEAAEPAKPVEAGEVVAALKKADLGVTATAVQDEDTDPNNLIGRPSGYVSRASADLPGGDKQAGKFTVDRGLVVEVFASADLAKKRSDYIKAVQDGTAVLGTEYHYFAGGGTALVRVTGKLKPSQAKKVEAAVAQL